MYQKDYIMRMIEELGLVIAALVGLREKGHISKALELIDETLTKRFDLNLDQLLEVEEEDFLVEVTMVTKDEGGLNIIAEMLLQYGMLLKDENGARALDSFVRSLLIFYYLDAESSTYNLGWADKINELDQLIRELED